MSKHDTKEDTLYYKSMWLRSAQLNVEVREKADYSHKNLQGEYVEQIEPAEVNIYHSPAKFEQDKFEVRLKNRQELNDYIAMLVDFEQRFGDLLDQVQTPEKNN